MENDMAEREISLGSVTGGSASRAPAPPKGKQAKAEGPAKASEAPAKKDMPLNEQLPKGASATDVVDFLISKPQNEIVPWEDCILPSKGIFYDGKIPEGKVRVRPMTLEVDKIMATSRLAQTGQALEKMYEHCVRLPNGFDHMDLLVGDRAFLLFYLRGITHGNDYEFVVTCSNEACKQQSAQSYDLNKLWGKVRSSKYQREPIRVDLPYFSKLLGRDVWADVKFLRQRDITRIEKKMKIRRAAVPGVDQSLDSTIEENLNMAIVSVNGVTDQMKISAVVARMHSKDIAIVRDTINIDAPGIDTDIEIRCPHCEQQIKIDLPITENFFRPKESPGTRERV